MTVSEHKLTATVLPVGATVPAYSVDRPEQGLLATSFENGLDGFVGSNGSISATKARTGTKSYRVTSSAAATSNSYVARLMPTLVAGAKYTARLWAASAPFVEPTRVAIAYTLGSANIITGPAVALGSGFVELVVSFTATADANTSLTIRVTKDNAANHDLFFDDYTLTRDAYTETIPAQVLPATPIPLSVIDGAITMDAGYQPYIRATLTCWTPADLSKVEQIDPRVTGVRVTLRATADYFGTRPGTARDFDLLLRARSIDPDTGTMTVTLASEEALLQDKRLVALNSERVFGLSVKTAVDYALAKIGKTVAAGFTDANVVTDALPATITNLMTNPSVTTGTTDWSHYSQNGAFTASRPTTGGVDAGPFYRAQVTTAITTTSASVRADYNNPNANAELTASIWVRSSIAISAHIRIAYLNAGSTATLLNVYGPDVVLTAGAWTRLEVKSTVPNGSAKHATIFEAVTASLPVGTQLDMDQVMVTTVPQTGVPYFDGATPDTGLVDYSWTGTANASTSAKVWKPNTDAMIWQPGVSASDWLEPLLNSTGLRLYADEGRIWRLLPVGTMVDGQVNVSPLTGLTRASDDINRDDDSFYDSVVVRYRWDDAEGRSKEAFDIAGAPGTKTRLVEIEGPIPKFGAAANILAAALGKGRTFDIEAISDYWAIPGKQVVLSVPDHQTAVGILRSVTYNFPEGDMSLGTRGIVDTPTTSWLLAPNGRRWQDIATGITWNTYA